jgi:hypothetical protein
MVNAGWPTLLAFLSFLLTTNLSGSIFGDAPSLLGASQTLTLPTPRGAFPGRSRFVCITLPRLPVSVPLEGLALGLAGSGEGGAAPRQATSNELHVFRFEYKLNWCQLELVATPPPGSSVAL